MTVSSGNLEEHLDAALKARASLLGRLHAEQTDAYRLFHGTVEGQPGLAVDLYGEEEAGGVQEATAQLYEDDGPEKALWDGPIDPGTIEGIQGKPEMYPASQVLS